MDGGPTSLAPMTISLLHANNKNNPANACRLRNPTWKLGATFAPKKTGILRRHRELRFGILATVSLSIYEPECIKALAGVSICSGRKGGGQCECDDMFLVHVQTCRVLLHSLLILFIRYHLFL